MSQATWVGGGAAPWPNLSFWRLGKAACSFSAALRLTLVLYAENEVNSCMPYRVRTLRHSNAGTNTVCNVLMQKRKQKCAMQYVVGIHGMCDS